MSEHTHPGDGAVAGLHGGPIPTPVLGCPACVTVRSVGDRTRLGLYLAENPLPLPAVGDPVVVHGADGATATLYVSHVEPREDDDGSFKVTFSATPALDHDHEWVDTTVLEERQRVEICAAGGCSATRRVDR